MGRRAREAALGAPAPPSALSAAEGPGDAAREAARAGLYVHVPFCARRCSYCDFASGVFSAAAAERWLAALEREAALRAPAAAGLVLTSVFFGGGTPSTLSPRHVARVARVLRAAFTIAPDAEITLEANPESVEPRRLGAWRAAGVDRLSLGAQSFHADELARLGRIHPPGRPGEAFALARAQGFRRLSLDLMYGFPGQRAERWRETLERALALEPEHLSAYAFTAEPGTPLGDAVLSGRECVPGDDEQAEAYETLLAGAARAGLGPYETSNLCRPGAEARHNLVYWLRRPYVGLGPSAHGLLAGERYGNHRSLDAWAAALERGAAPESEREKPEADSRAREVMLLGLRLTTGVRAADHEPGVWRETMARYGAALEEAVVTGRLVRREAGFALPRELRFVADEVIAWIEVRASAP